MMRSIKYFLTGLIASLLTLAAQAQSPAKPMRIIVPFAVGGASDTYTRLVAQKITEQTGKTVIVENKTGAGGRIAFDFVAHAAPDGLTVGLIDATYAMLPGLFPVLPWDINQDLIPVVMVAQTPFVVVVGADAKFSNYQELTRAAIAQPGQLNYGSAGVGSVNHIVTERFRSNAKIDITHIPYKGMSEASVALLSGNVDLIVAASPTAIGQIKSGKVRPLLVTTAQRSPVLPDVPAVTEVGLKDFVVTNWFGFAVPKGTPKEMMDMLHQDVMRAVAASDVKEKLLLQGAEASSFSTQEFGDFVKRETALWTQVTKDNNIKIEP
jgi:tripartite-type tricarboxylate transporter receptor subunit TctC